MVYFINKQIVVYSLIWFKVFRMIGKARSSFHLGVLEAVNGNITHICFSSNILTQRASPLIEPCFTVLQLHPKIRKREGEVLNGLAILKLATHQQSGSDKHSAVYFF